MILPEEIKTHIRNYITTRSGLYFKDHDLKDLQNVIEKRIHALKLASGFNYYSYLTSPNNTEDELRELLNLLTINHTYFFRNEAQFKALREKVLPEIISRKLKRQNSARAGEGDKPKIRIWSAGCSTGEEPYSIAIVLRELIPDPENWELQILATDASSEALKAAQEGIYNPNSVRPVDKDVLEKYFSAHKSPGASQGMRYKISDDIKEMVQFGYFNLMEQDYPQGFDIIFCRNVTIYFEFQTTLRTMNMLYESLNDPGYVFIGYSETLQYLQDKFKMIAWDEAIYYRKATKEAPETPVRPTLKPAAREKEMDEILEDIARAEVLAGVAKSKSPAPSQKIEDILVQIIKAMHQKEYAKAFQLINEASAIDPSAIDPYYLAAEIFMNQGKNLEAKNRLSTALKIDSLFAPAHYLLGCLYMEENAPDKAKESLRKAIYIDKFFLIAHFYIAQAFKNEGNIKDAMREYRNTLNLLSNARSEDIIAYSGGFSAATLMSVVRDNLERLKLEQ